MRRRRDSVASTVEQHLVAQINSDCTAPNVTRFSPFGSLLIFHLLHIHSFYMVPLSSKTPLMDIVPKVLLDDMGDIAASSDEELDRGMDGIDSNSDILNASTTERLVSDSESASNVSRTTHPIAASASETMP